MSFPISHIQDACKARKTTIAELERNSGIGNGVIKGWEKSKGTPQLHQLVAIAKCLDVPFDTIAFGDEKPAPTNEDGLTVSQRQLLQLLPLLTDQEVFVLSSTAQSLIASRKLPGSE